MPEDSGYQLEVVGPGDQFTLYRGYRPGEPPILAVGITAPHLTPQSVERLAHEYALGTDLDPAWAAVPLSLVRHDGRPLLVLEDRGDEPLDRLLLREGGQLDLDQFLAIAADMARALGQLHAKGLVHKDIKPANVLVDSERRIRFTGFGIASRILQERQVLAPPEVIAGTFAYMAPEQTGRMNRSVDARSDLYSLGITFYELLAGVPPFSAADPMEWIHCHIARQPIPPNERVPGLPAAVDAIVLKLLAKNPEDRYQTAAGLEIDLRRCLAQWEAEHRITPFALADRDVPHRLVMPEKLYGRERDVAVLVDALERVVTRGTTGLVLVSGYAGIGKSSIVNELHKVLVPSRGLFAAGKFDQYKSDIPYATLAQAFQGLIRQILSKNDDELATWRHELLTALGPNAQLMVNVIPELALVIGEQPPPPVVEPQDASPRFQRIFRSLIGVFARAAHPLVLFVDDLQWLDAGTLELLAHLVKEPDGLYLLIIGAFRDNEVGPEHPLSRTLVAIGGSDAVSEARLTPLTVNHVAQLCADALHTDVGRTSSLAELISEKTGGNPFFALQFIAALHDERLLTFDAARSAWQWDVDRIRAKGITDNVADLMAAKLSRLRPDTREALGQLACLGNVADLRTAALLRGDAEHVVQSTLREAVEAGLIVSLDRSFAFIHDRVHEAAYALMSPADRASAHLRIGRVLTSLAPAQESEDQIFEIVNQFARGLPAIDSQSEREFVANLHLAAGKRAKASGAYGSALAYFTAGRTMLGEDSWDRHYRLTFELELNCAECEIVGGELVTAEGRLTRLSQHARELDAQAQVVCLAVLLYFTTGRSQRAVEVSLDFLSKVGIVWPMRPTEAQVRAEYVEMRRLLAQRPVETLIDLAAMSDPVCITTMTVLTELFPAAYAVDRHLLELVLLRMTNLSLEHGHAESSSVAYSALNMAIGSHFGDYATAYALGQLACELVERRSSDRFKARVYSCFAAFTMPWFKHVPLCQPLMTQAFEIGRSNGDMAFATYNARNLMTHLLTAGTPLAEVKREAEQVMAFARKVQLGLPAERFIEQLALVRKLHGVDGTGDSPDDEWATGEVEAHPQLAMMVCYHWVFRLQEAFVSGDMSAALAAAARVEPIRWAMRSSIEEAEYDFYAALSRAAACDDASPEQRDRHLDALVVHYERIARWAEHCPENFDNRKALIGAEIARVEGRDLTAQHLYEDAVRLARDHGFVQNQAFANERAGGFYAVRGLATIADAYLGHARDCYERWGALGKVRQLETRYPQLRTRAAATVGATTIDKPLAQLDVETVDKASQTLSSEMMLPSLLEKLVRLAVEHAGAERGLLVLLRDGTPHVEAEALTGHGNVTVTRPRKPVAPSDLPQSALQYVLRTHERLLLDDASADGLDQTDEYVQRRQPRSVLCLPIFKEALVIGALYLENNLTTRAFTAGRVAVLDFLASQAAIWLDNARLYSDLRRNEAWLKEAQHLSSTGSFYWGVDSDTVEFSEQMFRLYELDPNQPVTPALVMTRIHPDDLPIMQEMIDVARGSGGDLDYLFRAQMPDLSVKYLHMVAHGARDKDGRLDYVGAVQDVTQRRLSEEALGQVRSELAHVARVTSLGLLTASIAHEVNQPLSGIVTNASTCLRMLAAEPPNLDGARETTRRMMRDGHRAAEVITRLRALFTRTEAATESVDLSEATREVIALSGSELRKSGVMLRADLEADLPPVIGDRVQLQQVILNLLLNAADAVRSVTNRPRHVAIRIERDEDHHVRLTVRDTGVGIEPESVPRLFEAFFSTKAGGMGIGLSVSRSIIENHHGRIWATANEGPGAAFSFVLPCSDPASSPTVADSR